MSLCRGHAKVCQNPSVCWPGRVVMRCENDFEASACENLQIRESTDKAAGLIQFRDYRVDYQNPPMHGQPPIRTAAHKTQWHCVQLRLSCSCSAGEGKRTALSQPDQNCLHFEERGAGLSCFVMSAFGTMTIFPLEVSIGKSVSSPSGLSFIRTNQLTVLAGRFPAFFIPT